MFENYIKLDLMERMLNEKRKELKMLQLDYSVLKGKKDDSDSKRASFYGFKSNQEFFEYFERLEELVAHLREDVEIVKKQILSFNPEKSVTNEDRKN